MAVLARKVSLAKWAVPNGFATGEIGADAVSELRASENTLSFWTCSSASPDELNKVVLAIAAQNDRVDKLDLAWVSDHAISVAGLATRATLGVTPIESLRPMHVDIERLDWVRHGKVVHALAAGIRNAQQKRHSRGEVLTLLVAAVRDGTVAIHSLKDQVANAVREKLGPVPASDESAQWVVDVAPAIVAVELPMPRPSLWARLKQWAWSLFR